MPAVEQESEPRGERDKPARGDNQWSVLGGDLLGGAGVGGIGEVDGDDRNWGRRHSGGWGNGSAGGDRLARGACSLFSGGLRPVISTNETTVRTTVPGPTLDDGGSNGALHGRLDVLHRR